MEIDHETKRDDEDDEAEDDDSDSDYFPSEATHFSNKANEGLNDGTGRKFGRIKKKKAGRKAYVKKGGRRRGRRRGRGRPATAEKVAVGAGGGLINGKFDYLPIGKDMAKDENGL